MQERIDSIRQDVDSIRKSGKLPHWRMVYADALLARAQDYMAVDRSPEAVRVLDKLDRWVDSHRPKVADNGRADFAPISIWNAEMLTDVVNRIRKTLSAKGPLIVRLRRSYRARLAAVMAYRSGNYAQPEGTQVGLYNAQHTLEETLHIVGERDPIWIEDFLEIYNELFRIVEKLNPQEKK